MLSSPTSMSHLVISTRRHRLGSIASVFGERGGALTVTPSTTTSSQSVGTKWNVGEFCNVTPVTLTFLQFVRTIRRGRGSVNPGVFCRAASAGPHQFSPGAVNRPFAGDGDVGELAASDERNEVAAALGRQPIRARFQKRCLLARRLQFRAFIELQRRLAAQGNRLAQIRAGRQLHDSAAGLAAFVERLLNRVGVQRLAVAFGPELPDVEDFCLIAGRGRICNADGATETERRTSSNNLVMSP